MTRTDSTAPWTVVVFTVSGLREQQRILADFRTAAMSGITALGTQNASDFFVVAECRTEADQMLVERVVEAMDPDARRTYTFGPGQGLAATARATAVDAVLETDPTG